MFVLSSTYLVSVFTTTCKVALYAISQQWFVVIVNMYTGRIAQIYSYIQNSPERSKPVSRMLTHHIIDH